MAQADWLAVLMLHLTQQVLVWAVQPAAEVAVSLAALAAAAWETSVPFIVSVDDFSSRAVYGRPSLALQVSE